MVQTRSASSSPIKGASVNGAAGQEMTRYRAHEAAERAAAPEVRVLVAHCGEHSLQAPSAGRPGSSRCCSGAAMTANLAGFPVEIPAGLAMLGSKVPAMHRQANRLIDCAAGEFQQTAWLRHQRMQSSSI